MLKFMKALLLAGLTLFGIACLLATPAPPHYSSPIKIITRNPVETHRSYYSDGAHNLASSFACKNDKITIEWKTSFSDSSGVTLTAEPSNMLEPELTQELLSDSGSKEVTVKGEVALIIKTKATLKQVIKMLPENLCTAFPIIPVAEYSGQFSQTKPVMGSLKKDFRIYWDARTDNLMAAIYEPKDKNSDSNKPYSYRAQSEAIMNCEASITTKMISCVQVKNNNGWSLRELKMNINVNKTGLSGNYSAETKNNLGPWTTVGGTIQFVKKQ